MNSLLNQFQSCTLLTFPENERETKDLLSRQDLSAYISVRKFISNCSSANAIERILFSPVFPLIVEGLSCDYEIQFEALWIITNLCSGSSFFSEYMVKNYNLLHKLDFECSGKVFVQQAWVIGNLSIDSDEYVEFFVQRGYIQKILHALRQNLDEDTLGWVLGNVLRLESSRVYFSSLHLTHLQGLSLDFVDNRKEEDLASQIKVMRI